MNVTWIIDPDAFSDYAEDLVREIQVHGHTAKTLPPFFSSYEFGDTSRFYDELAPEDDCVICHAPFEFTDLATQDELWTPGTYGNNAQVDFSSYASQLLRYLLNREHELIPFEEIAARADSLIGNFGVQDHVFLRPDSGRKTFAGRLYSRAELVGRTLPASRMAPTSLVVVSRPKPIAREWRFIVVDREIVAASRYKEFDRVELSNQFEPRAYDFASLVAQHDFPRDRVWVLDTCETPNGDMFVLEINGFSSSNWYRCDLRSIVAAVSRAALEDWQTRL